MVIVKSNMILNVSYLILFASYVAVKGNVIITENTILQKMLDLETQVKELKELHQSQATNKECTDGWVAYGGSCYLFGSEKVTFIEALLHCLQHGTNLVHVGTHEENNFLKAFITTQLKGDAHYWLGMTDTTEEGIWKWYGEGTVVNYFDWLPGQPNNSTSDEDCALFHYGVKYLWADTPCNSHAKGVCEKRIEGTE